MLLACLYVHAEDVSKDVTLEAAGTLSEQVGDDKLTITSLKVSGPLNGADILCLREMAGSDVNGNATEGVLADLDLSCASIVKDATNYYYLTYNTKENILGDYAFYECGKLRTVVLPSTVTSIGSSAFQYCTSLESVTIPESVTSIGMNAFFSCSSLVSVNIPDAVTSIGDNAFYSCSSLQSVTIPEGVTKIGGCMFQKCSKLECVTIPDAVTSIGSQAFDGCKSLTSVTIGKSVTSIGTYAFSLCSSLSDIIIPGSMESIGSCAFRNCTGLKSVTVFGKTLPECATNAFSNVPSSAILYCRTALKETCGTTAPWSGFTNIETVRLPVSVSDAGIATACFDEDLDFTNQTDVKAYIATGFSPAAGTVLLTRVMAVPANTGFILKGAEGTYNIPLSETDYMYVNMLVGTLKSISLSKSDGSNTNYVLGTGDDGVGFYVPGENCTIPANKAYLQIPASAAAAKRSIDISFDDEDSTATGFIPVRELTGGNNGKSTVYDLNGQRKQGLSKGLNIVDGKKMFIR